MISLDFREEHNRRRLPCAALCMGRTSERDAEPKASESVLSWRILTLEKTKILEKPLPELESTPFEFRRS
uniref:Uncharacterized protein n=1 Tax=Candidatus Kentrum sp. FM TaxID=2126340 RepID=A0A450SET1_9GAMM|nr:MAG: hypothetical protein BECKFM1743A_GA0114220_100913 [Candidatus Kentron sp. FM]VFJ51244.1 MAG: hypothetical protein BECKFM1743C_GA0114222_100953 [Candidatus Kentron sp. FM]VFK08868.1 MAG: hypothetical protein BECKFM1743B_GA0114221_100843 [Candidatus Kentron sp. FM]